MRRLVKIVAPAKPACPFHHLAVGAKPICGQCRRAFTATEIREFRDACNGDERCSLGVHVASVCEYCAHHTCLESGGHP